MAPAPLQQAYQLVQEADLMAAKAELELPEAEQAAQHAETARSALTQVKDSGIAASFRWRCRGWGLRERAR